MKPGRWVRSSTAYRSVMRRLGASPLAVCEYNAWDRYTIKEIRPDALRIALRPGETSRGVFSGIPESARVVLMHINLSRTEGIIAGDAGLRASLLSRGTILLNGDATDIRKRTIQERCEALGLPSARARREGPSDERLIVKTNLNYGGGPELALTRDLGRRAERFTGVPGVSNVAPIQYSLYRRSQVPSAIWADPSLVVERFVENRAGVIFRVYIVGPATCVGEVWSDYDIKKLSLPVRARVNHFFWSIDDAHVAVITSTDTVARVVALTRRVFQALGADYGAGDCVMGDDGELVVVDVNKTPYWGDDVRPDVIGHLRRGLDHVIGDGR